MRHKPPLGFCLDEENDLTVELVMHNGRLAIEVLNTPVALELYPPDEEGKWALHLNAEVSISFNESEDAQVVSSTAHTPEGDFVRPRVEDSHL